MFVGIDCISICGDSDGNGDPGVSAFPSELGTDPADFGADESMAMLFWPNPPETFNPTGSFEDYNDFYPTFIVGVPSGGSESKNVATAFDSYTWLENYNDDICDPLIAPYPYPNNDPDYSTCVLTHSFSFPDAKYNFGSKIYQISGTNNEKQFKKKINKPTYFSTPSAAFPDFEFTLYNFSNYYDFNFVPGSDPIRFAFAFYFGAENDAVGEEVIRPVIYSVPCAIQDDCGVCGGNSKWYLYISLNNIF